MQVRQATSKRLYNCFDMCLSAGLRQRAIDPVMASREGSGYATAGAGIESVDECGLRFLMAMKQHEYLLRCLPIKQRHALAKVIVQELLEWGQSGKLAAAGWPVHVAHHLGLPLRVRSRAAQLHSLHAKGHA